MLWIRRSPVCVLATVLFVSMSFAVSFAQAPQPPVDEVSTAAIKEATTRDDYGTPWVNVLYDHPTVPSPRDVLGRIVGAPGEVTSVDAIHDYMRALAQASDRVAVFSAGESFEGREMIVVAIAEAATLARLDENAALLHRLADPRVTDAATAESIVPEAKPVYWLTAGLHSPELGPPEMVMELAYRLATEERDPFPLIRNNVITLITPVLETDGRARQVDWYYRHVKGHTDYKDMPPRSSPLWGHYTFHDNNRDGIAISQPLTQNYLNTFFRWLPTVSLDLHESVPLLYVSTGTGPYNERIDPLTVSEWQAIASYEVSRLTGLGLPGVWTWGFYTGWFPGYLLWVTNNHNTVGRFYETFGNGSADTMERDLRKARYAGKPITSRQWYRSIPPDKDVTWSMRDNTNFMESGAIASLEMVARNRDMFLRNFYQKGVNAIALGRDETPHAFVLKGQQRDAGAARAVVEVLQRHGIELDRVTRKTELEGVTLEKGDLLVRLDQPYGPLARNLLEKQDFPEDVEVPPYDDVAWTLGLHFGVDVQPVDDAAVLEAPADRLDGNANAGAAANTNTTNTDTDTNSEPFAVDLPDKARVWAIPHRAQQGLGPLRFALGDIRVRDAAEDFEVGKETMPAGTLLIDGQDVDATTLRAMLQGRGVRAVALKKMPDVATNELDLPRVAVFMSWASTQNCGWVRFTLDDAGVPYTLITKDRVRSGDLRGDFDVILVPALWGGMRAADVVAGIDPRWSPLAYTSTTEFPNHGSIASSADITGGLGFDGMAEIDRFVQAGGTLVALGSGGVVAAESGMLHQVETSRPGGLRTPGSFLTAKVLQTNPLTYGYEELTHVFRGNGPLFSVAEHDRYLVAMQFGTKEVGKEKDQEGDADEGVEDQDNKNKKGDGRNNSNNKSKTEKTPLVISGGVIKGEAIDGEPALLYVAHGQGRVVLFGWNPMHRFLNHHDHAFVYNALLHWNDLPVPKREPRS